MTSIFDPIRLGAVSLDVMACGRAAPDALAARQKTRLALLLKAAVRGSRFYREQMSGMSPETTPLTDLPVVSRNELMARFDDWVTDPQLKLAELRAFTLDSRRIGEPYLGKYLIWESSGTSNEPDPNSHRNATTMLLLLLVATVLPRQLLIVIRYSNCGVGCPRHRWMRFVSACVRCVPVW